MAVYIMHKPFGYELRRIPSPVPLRYISSTTPLDSQSGSSRARRCRVEPSWCAPRVSASRSAGGAPVTPDGRSGSPFATVREVQKVTPGPSSHRARGQT
ncbi:unnamed protein product [Lupinus luteus]|uniref:Uncharacterized protein n=1 Tax=Lupinus luteus TaxID=3873 RepID=A0AAV1YF61_LUPLU